MTFEKIIYKSFLVVSIVTILLYLIGLTSMVFFDTKLYSLAIPFAANIIQCVLLVLYIIANTFKK